MSDSNNISNHPGPGSAAEPSMEEILASIRRILKEDDGERASVDEPEDEELVLSSAMMAAPADISTATEPPAQMGLLAAQDGTPEAAVHEPVHFASEPEMATQLHEPVAEIPEDDAEDEEPLTLTAEDETLPLGQRMVEEAEQEPEITLAATPEEHDMEQSVQAPDALIGDEVEHAIANTVGTMMRSIRTERAVSVTHGGLTIEDIVREEIKPMLKAWLDTHLASLVERIVRAEIGRVIDRTQL
jgi:cell pole-organizing protein PopZ